MLCTFYEFYIYWCLFYGIIIDLNTLYMHLLFAGRLGVFDMPSRSVVSQTVENVFLHLSQVEMGRYYPTVIATMPRNVLVIERGPKPVLLVAALLQDIGDRSGIIVAWSNSLVFSNFYNNDHAMNNVCERAATLLFLFKFFFFPPFPVKKSLDHACLSTRP